jgi:hypothetical protein
VSREDSLRTAGSLDTHELIYRIASISTHSQVSQTGVLMSVIDTCINLHYRLCPELILADCRNQIDALQNLSHLAAMDAISNSPQQQHLVRMELHLHLLADMLFLPA